MLSDSIQHSTNLLSIEKQRNMEESPFAVVIPKDRNMSSYLKKSGFVGPSSPCTDTTSKSSNTMETSFSTITNSGFFPPNVGPSLSNSKKSFLSSSFSSSDGSTNFAWGDVLDFPQQGFGDSFPDDVLVEKSFDKDRKGSSWSNLVSASMDPFGFEEEVRSRKPPKASSTRNISVSDDVDRVRSSIAITSLDHGFTFEEAFAQTTDTGFQEASALFRSDPFIASPTSGKVEERHGTSKARHSRSPKVEQTKKRSSNETGRTGGSRGVIYSELPMPMSPTVSIAGKKSSSSRRIADATSPRKGESGSLRPRDNSLLSRRSRSVPRATSPQRTSRVSHRCRRASIASGDMGSSLCAEASVDAKRSPGSAEKLGHDRPRRRGSLSHEPLSGGTGRMYTIDSTNIPVMRTKNTISGRTSTNTSKSPLLTRKKSVSGPAHRPTGDGVRRKRQTTPTTSPNMALFRKGHFHHQEGKQGEDEGCNKKNSVL